LPVGIAAARASAAVTGSAQTLAVLRRELCLLLIRRQATPLFDLFL
jgi:hypothetical protein